MTVHSYKNTLETRVIGKKYTVDSHLNNLIHAKFHFEQWKSYPTHYISRTYIITLSKCFGHLDDTDAIINLPPPDIIYSNGV